MAIDFRLRHWLRERSSDAQQLLGHVSRHAVDEEDHYGQQQQRHHQLHDQPLVVAGYVADGLQGHEEPQEGGVWTTEGGGWGGMGGQTG